MVAVPKLEVLQEVVPHVLWGCKRQYVIIMDCVDSTRSNIWTILITCMDIAYSPTCTYIPPNSYSNGGNVPILRKIRGKPHI